MERSSEIVLKEAHRKRQEGIRGRSCRCVGCKTASFERATPPCTKSQQKAPPSPFPPPLHLPYHIKNFLFDLIFTLTKITRDTQFHVSQFESYYIHHTSPIVNYSFQAIAWDTNCDCSHRASKPVAETSFLLQNTHHLHAHISSYRKLCQACENLELSTDTPFPDNDTKHLSTPTGPRQLFYHTYHSSAPISNFTNPAITNQLSSWQSQRFTLVPSTILVVTQPSRYVSSIYLRVAFPAISTYVGSYNCTSHSSNNANDDSDLG